MEWFNTPSNKHELIGSLFLFYFEKVFDLFFLIFDQIVHVTLLSYLLLVSYFISSLPEPNPTLPNLCPFINNNRDCLMRSFIFILEFFFLKIFIHGFTYNSKYLLIAWLYYVCVCLLNLPRNIYGNHSIGRSAWYSNSNLISTSWFWALARGRFHERFCSLRRSLPPYTWLLHHKKSSQKLCIERK